MPASLHSSPRLQVLDILGRMGKTERASIGAPAGVGGLQAALCTALAQQPCSLLHRLCSCLSFSLPPHRPPIGRPSLSHLAAPHSLTDEAYVDLTAEAHRRLEESGGVPQLPTNPGAHAGGMHGPAWAPCGSCWSPLP